MDCIKQIFRRAKGVFTRRAPKRDMVIGYPTDFRHEQFKLPNWSDDHVFNEKAEAAAKQAEAQASGLGKIAQHRRRASTIVSDVFRPGHHRGSSLPSDSDE